MGIQLNSQEWVTDGENYIFADVANEEVGIREYITTASVDEWRQVIEALELAIEFYESHKSKGQAPS